MKKTFLFLAALLTATVMNLQAATVSNVKYIDADGTEKTCASATVVENASSVVTWNSGWYVVTGNTITLSKGATCNGTVHLILKDGAKLVAQGVKNDHISGILVTGTNSLAIYGQTNQTGELEANGYTSGAGIGGEFNIDGKNITINGGKVTAKGGGSAAGIGGGNKGHGKDIIINGGIVTATGGNSAAGIGGGSGNSQNFDITGSYITINGGTVTAKSGGNGAGIGGGQYGGGSDITIKGGTVTAESTGSGAGIGGGSGMGTSNIVTTGSNIIIEGGEVTAKGGSSGAGIGGGQNGNGSNITIKGGTVTATGGNSGAGIGGGRNGFGKYITINGGEVTTAGGYTAAGIGGGATSTSSQDSESAVGSHITINGGVVTATGNYGGAGIGAGSGNGYAYGSDITINGGKVTASSTSTAIGSSLSKSTPSNIFVNPSLILKADNDNPPTTVIEHASITTDVALSLKSKHYATVEMPITGVSLTGYNAAYDGQGHAIQVSGTKAGDVINYSTDNTNWQSTNPSYTNVCSATTVYVRVQRTNYVDWYGDATVAITARAITMTSASDSKQYDGEPLTNGSVTITTGSLAGSDAVSYDVTGSQTEVGSSPNTFTYAFTTGSASNYAITQVVGTLEVTAIPVLSETITKEELTALKGQTLDVKVGRTMQVNGTRHTICLPFSLSESEFAASPFAGCTSLQEFESATIENPGAENETLVLNMTEVSPKAIEAGKPYIITWPNDGTQIEYPQFDQVTIETDVAESEEPNPVSFCGTFVPYQVESGDKGILFINADGKLNWPNANGNINGFRCYFALNLSQDSPLRRGMAAMLGEGRTTPTSVEDASCNMYDVRKLIEEGRVVIISNGVRYDMNGNLVK